LGGGRGAEGDAMKVCREIWPARWSLIIRACQLQEILRDPRSYGDPV
jgi:hypothetical protein